MLVTCTFIVPPRPQLVSSLPKSFQPLLLTPTPSLHYQTLSDAEIKNYHERGQCFYCNQKFSCNHCCQGCYLVLVVEEDDNPPSYVVRLYDGLISSEEEPTSSIESPLTHLSLNAMFGLRPPKTFHVMGPINSPTPLLLVMVGSSKELICKNVYFSIEGHLFSMDIFILEMCGYDAILGA